MSTATRSRHDVVATCADCTYRPHPALFPPPPCWVGHSSHRERLDLAFAVLRRHGIAALPAMGEDPDPVRRTVEAVLADRFPYGAGSYAFWTTTDDERCIDAAGDLVTGLPLHHAPHLSAALAFVLEGVHLPSAVLPDGRSTVVLPPG